MKNTVKGIIFVLIIVIVFIANTSHMFFLVNPRVRFNHALTLFAPIAISYLIIFRKKKQIKPIPLKEIEKKDNFALSAVIDYWKENTSSSVLGAYAELRKRNFSFSVSNINNLQNFSHNYKQPDVDAFLVVIFEKNNCKSYEELLIKEFVIE